MASINFFMCHSLNKPMRSIFIFNPENDLALANGGPNYTAPPFAQQLRRDLQLLPAWYAPAGSAVVCKGAKRAQRWLNAQGLNVEAMEPEWLRGIGGCRFEPWGWSPAMLHWLEGRGVGRDCLPTTAQVDGWRGLSHRRTSLAIHRAIAAMAGGPLSPEPVELDRLDAVLRFAAAHPSCYVKSPWSGSGRGVYRVLQPSARDFAQWCSGIIKRQGSVMCEQALDRCLDFALELRCSGGGCRVDGYSVFASDFHSQYAHGIVAGADELRAMVAELYPGFDAVEQMAVESVRRVVAARYTGWIGLDMLLYRTSGGTVGIDPCVELNLRPTMGLVAAACGRRGMRGRFMIAAPHSVAAGATLLTPVGPDSAFCAAVVPEKG